ncbi:SHOCT domain-containing protein [Halobacillus sp. Marseille-P3879]|uniref:SHOCT domain-containing protein n=1 Tax=Halobacillus sp. Marseille-P3879 TaxID=2045014 RepID=UPI000C7E0A06|nr:SHOCT domain-containing protein [Halobacillus sp. Marseille-P3879]
MASRYRIKPSKSASVLGIVIGCIFIFAGITLSSQLGTFGIIWTIAAIVITGYHVLNLCSDSGASVYRADLEKEGAPQAGSSNDPETQIRQLHRLKEDNMISKEEYQKKKTELLNTKW